MIGIALICLFYYSKPEKTYFVWNFSLSPKNFLFEKIKTCCINFSLLSVPIAIGLSIFFPKEVLSIAVLFLFFIPNPSKKPISFWMIKIENLSKKFGTKNYWKRIPSITHQRKAGRTAKCLR